MLCQKCGAQNDGESVFCGKCGLPLSEPAPPSPRVCDACGSTIAEGMIFCGKCGAKAGEAPAPQQEVCSRCGSLIEDGLLFCSKCGTKVGMGAAPAASEPPQPQSPAEPPQQQSPAAPPQQQSPPPRQQYSSASPPQHSTAQPQGSGAYNLTVTRESQATALLGAGNIIINGVDYGSLMGGTSKVINLNSPDAVIEIRSMAVRSARARLRLGNDAHVGFKFTGMGLFMKIVFTNITGAEILENLS